MIGRTLVEKVGVKPHLVLTERQDLLGLRELVAIPVACVDELPAGSLPTVAAETSTARETTEAAVSDEAVPNNGNLLEPTEPVVVDQSLRADSTDAGTVREPVPSPSILESSIAEPALAIDENAAATNGTSSAEVLEPTRSGEATVEVKRSGAARAKAQEGDCSPIQLGRQLLRFHVAHGEDRTVASRGARVVPNNADLREPFERVREALGETARMGGAR